MGVVWTHSFSSSDDGNILNGVDLQNIQSDIDTYTVQLAGTQTVTGNKTFSGTTTFSGTLDGAIGSDKFLFWENDVISYENEMVFIT